MFKLNLNKITIIVNLFFLVLIAFYFLFNLLNFDNKKDIINKKSESLIKKNKDIINNKLALNKLSSGITIDNVLLPEVITKKTPKNKIKKLIYLSNKTKIIKVKVTNLKALEKYNVLDLNKKNNEEITPIKYESKQKIKIQKNIPDKTNVNNVNKFIDMGIDLLNNSKKKFQLEFLWPLDSNYHDNIYKILNKCLRSETVLIDTNNIIYGLNGKIERSMFTQHFSNIIRIPTNVYSSLEKQNINKIRNKYLGNANGRHLRLFKKNIDAYIIGFYLNLAQKQNLKINKIKGYYKIIDNDLYIDQLSINSIFYKEKILLSSLNKTCSI